MSFIQVINQTIYTVFITLLQLVIVRCLWIVPKTYAIYLEYKRDPTFIDGDKSMIRISKASWIAEACKDSDMIVDEIFGFGTKRIKQKIKSTSELKNVTIFCVIYLFISAIGSHLIVGSVTSVDTVSYYKSPTQIKGPWQTSMVDLGGLITNETSYFDTNVRGLPVIVGSDNTTIIRNLVSVDGQWAGVKINCETRGMNVTCRTIALCVSVGGGCIPINEKQIVVSDVTMDEYADPFQRSSQLCQIGLAIPCVVEISYYEQLITSWFYLAHNGWLKYLILDIIFIIILKIFNDLMVLYQVIITANFKGYITGKLWSKGRKPCEKTQRYYIAADFIKDGKCSHHWSNRTDYLDYGISTQDGLIYHYGLLTPEQEIIDELKIKGNRTFGRPT
jgi:hypothetical protein